MTRPTDQSTSKPAPSTPVDLSAPHLYSNRELSWLEFNRRVLEEAQDPSVPLLERLKFLAIFCSNLDEFFMVRVAGLKELVVAGIDKTGPDGLPPEDQLAAISALNHKLIDDLYDCAYEQVLPGLKQEGIVLLKIEDLSRKRFRDLENYYHSDIAPVLTPLALDPSHPFPMLSNKSLNLAIIFEHDTSMNQSTGVDLASAFALIQVPSVLPRLIPVRNHNYSQAYVLLEDLISTFCGTIFDGLKVQGAALFRVTRNGDFTIDDEEMEDLLHTIDRKLRNRQRRRVVRLELESSMPDEIRAMLMEKLEVEEDDVYEINGLLDLTSLMTIYKNTQRRSLKDPPFNPRLSPDLATGQDIFSVIREKDIFLHHPYESFSSVVEFLESAAEDPNVLAIKQTLYRTAGDSSIVRALIRGANAGKQVTVLVELRARFDEMNNIQWARHLEKSGVHVVYGVVGLKTHCKAAMVVRRDSDGLRRYVHLGTGNYNSTTAKLYTDMGLLTSHPEITEEVSRLFNLLTGFNYVTGAKLLKRNNNNLAWKHLQMAPVNLHRDTQELIEAEIENAKQGKPARIIAKMNSLVDPTTIKNLYRASRAGVQIDLIIRGICCLKPGIPGVSENIRVLSILDRFLEHSRVFFFEGGGQQHLYVGSADWMPRNFFSRIEVVFPILHEPHKKRILDHLLMQLKDNVKGREGQPHGPYTRIATTQENERIRAQDRCIALARKNAIKTAPYEETLVGARKSRMSKLKKRS